MISVICVDYYLDVHQRRTCTLLHAVSITKLARTRAYLQRTIIAAAAAGTVKEVALSANAADATLLAVELFL
jgi:hypothetical protein